MHWYFLLFAAAIHIFASEESMYLKMPWLQQFMSLSLTSSLSLRCFEQLGQEVSLVYMYACQRQSGLLIVLHVNGTEQTQKQGTKKMKQNNSEPSWGH